MADPLVRLLTVAETAARLRCSERRVFELLADGTLVRGRAYGRRTVVTSESVEAALEAPPVDEAPKKRVRHVARASLSERLSALSKAARAGEI